MRILILNIFVCAALCGCDGDSGSSTSAKSNSDSQVVANASAESPLPAEETKTPAEIEDELNRIISTEDNYVIFNEGRKLINDLSPDQLVEFFEVVDTSGMQETKQRSLKQNIMRNLASRAPEVGWDLLNTVSAGSLRRSLLGTFMATLDPKDVLASLDRIHDLPFPEDITSAKSVFTRSLNDLPPATLRETLNTYREDEVISSILARAYGSAVGAADGGYDEISHLEGASREAALTTWAGKRIHVDPGQIADSIATGAIPNEDASLIISSVALGYWQSDPAQAREWAAALSSDDLGGNAVNLITSMWLREDPGAASEWILSLNQGVRRDWAARNVVDHLVEHGDMEAAEIWAEQIVDEAARTSAEHALRRAAIVEKGQADD